MLPRKNVVFERYYLVLRYTFNGLVPIMFCKDNKVLVDEKYGQIQKYFYRSTPIKRVGSLLLLFSGFAFIGLSIMVGIRTIPKISLAFQYFKEILLLHWTWVILAFTGGFFANKLYSGKNIVFLLRYALLSI